MKTITIAMAGSGGAGVAALGDILLRTVARQGYFGLLRKTLGPQIRGGESATIVRIGPEPIACFNGTIDALFVLDWNNFQHVSDEIPITHHTLLFQDQKAGKAPAHLVGSQKMETLDLSGLARKFSSAHSNLALLGYLSAWLQCPIRMDSMEMRLMWCLVLYPLRTVISLLPGLCVWPVNCKPWL